MKKKMNLKKLGAVCCAALMMAACLTGCGGAAASPASSAPAASFSAGSAPAALTGTVATGGSTSMEKVMAALQEAWAEKEPEVTVTYDPTGSGAGITGAMEGTLDIGLSSRQLKDSETGVEATVLALDGIALVVNKENPVNDLTMEQAAAIARGEIDNWSQLGGTDTPIVLVGREAGSGTRDGFESILGVEDECVYAQELTATGAVVAAVASNPGAIGYASLSAVEDTVKALTVGGTACSEATVLDGSYPIQRPFVLVTRQGAEPSPAAAAFVKFALSADAADLIRAAGAVPLA